MKVRLLKKLRGDLRITYNHYQYKYYVEMFNFQTWNLICVKYSMEYAIKVIHNEMSKRLYEKGYYNIIY